MKITDYTEIPERLDFIYDTLYRNAVILEKIAQMITDLTNYTMKIHQQLNPTGQTQWWLGGRTN